MDEEVIVFKEYWAQVNEEIPNQISRKWGEEIVLKYRESQRYYHTLHHVLQMKQLKDVHVHKLQNPKLVDYAIIFHE